MDERLDVLEVAFAGADAICDNLGAEDCAARLDQLLFEQLAQQARDDALQRACDSARRARALSSSSSSSWGEFLLKSTSPKGDDTASHGDSSSESKSETSATVAGSAERATAASPVGGAVSTAAHRRRHTRQSRRFSYKKGLDASRESGSFFFTTGLVISLGLGVWLVRRGCTRVLRHRGGYARVPVRPPSDDLKDGSSWILPQEALVVDATFQATSYDSRDPPPDGMTRL